MLIHIIAYEYTVYGCTYIQEHNTKTANVRASKFIAPPPRGLVDTLGEREL